MAQIRIDSILGGMTQLQNAPQKDQFTASIGIDPSMGNIGVNNISTATGSLVPVQSVLLSGSTLTNAPMWISTPHPKPSSKIFVYDLAGSAYTAVPRTPAFTALSDGGSLSNSTGNGMEYYDNYMYFAKNTTVARYGPLDGTPAFDGDYWGTTLAKTALTNNTYPQDGYTGYTYPNHFLHRHSDGKLYIADVVGNQGTIHYISTTKTTVEGDTDNGSKASALTFGYGLWPTAIESYGGNLAIALFEGQDENVRGQRAKLAFWDTTSTNFNSITWVEFPDPVITAMKNIDGVLYIFSGMNNAPGFRVSRYVGGATVQEVYYGSLGYPPFPGGVDGSSKRLLFGSQVSLPSSNSPGCVYSFGLQQGIFAQKLFPILGASFNGNSIVTALALTENIGMGIDYPTIGWTKGTTGGSNNGVDACAPQNGQIAGQTIKYAEWYSQVYKIGQPFEIKKIRIPIFSLDPTDTITVSLFLDGAGFNPLSLTPITTANFPFTFTAPNSATSSYTIANIRPDAQAWNLPADHGYGQGPIRGYNSFMIGLVWTRGGNGFSTVDLPILIDFEIIPD